jgi:uncharacterized protein (TIGR03435 family)
MLVRLIPALILICVVQPLRIWSQSAASFDVASVKPQPWNGQGSVGVFFHGNTLSAEHCDLYELVEFAWNLKELQVSGGPPWAKHGLLATSQLYQVIGKTEQTSTPDTREFRLMLQTLLLERFQLKLHHLERSLPVYYLVVAKNGPKLKPSPGDVKGSMTIDSGSGGRKLTRIVATHASIGWFIGHMEYYAGRTVFDKTGLDGLYDLTLEWTPDDVAAQTDAASLPNPLGPSLFTALENQLGLKLAPATADFDTVVIDHAERPSAN